MNIDEVRAYALSMPSVTEEPHHEASSFRVNGKIFATLPPGDEFIHVFVDEPDRQTAVAFAPDAYEILFWGEKVSGLRIRISKAKLNDVVALLHNAWARKASKKLASSHHSKSRKR